MQYISTNGNCPIVNTAEAVTHCMAADGGLYIPKALPFIPKALFNNIGEMNLREIAFIVASSLLSDELDPAQIKHIVDESFAVDIPFVRLSEKEFIMELFHGPSLTFKDYGAHFMARLLREFDTRKGIRKRNVLVSTTGNSGAATANGLFEIEGLNVAVLFPKNVLSHIQMAQFTSLGSNIYPVEVDGTIEDCKNLVRDAIADPTLKDLSLTGANSINVGRLIPQIAFAFRAYAELKAAGVEGAEDAIYSIPSGNLSNLVAAMLGVQMGLPLGKVLAAENVNDTLGRISRGERLADKPVHTLARSLDTVHPSGLPRLTHICGDSLQHPKLTIAPAIDDDTIVSTIKYLSLQHNYLIDPHGAVAYAAAQLVDTDAPKVVFATGHPIKSIDAMTRITGTNIELPKQYMRFMNGKRRVQHIAPTLPALRRYLRSIN